MNLMDAKRIHFTSKMIMKVKCKTIKRTKIAYSNYIIE